MKKGTVCTVISLFVTGLSFAQKQNVYFLKDSGQPVSVRDSADYVRIVREPDSSSKLYNVLDYGLNGKLKFLGKSTTIFPSKFEGVCADYFENGKKKCITEYKSGVIVNKQYLFYPNGKAYAVFEYPVILSKNESAPLQQSFTIISCNDSTGVPKVINGNGYYTSYDNKFTTIAEEGPVKNGKRDGIWKGTILEQKIVFTETYSNGDMLKGVSVAEYGDTVVYNTARIIPPQYQGGINKFYEFLGTHIRYPPTAFQNGIQGRVVLGFFVEKNGSLTDIEILQSAHPLLDAEALRVCYDSKKWLPGSVCGRYVRRYYNVPIVFSLQRIRL